MKRSIFILSIVFSLFAVSCKKNQLGGKSTISGVVLHHSKVIANATVFIKFKAKDFPGADTTLYDAKVRADVNGNYSFNCYKGDYFLYGFGIDPSETPPYVKGGVPVHIRNNEKITQNVQVVEG